MYYLLHLNQDLKFIKVYLMNLHIEPPVWSSLIANLLLKNYHVKILDAEADNLTHEETAQKIADLSPKLVVFMVWSTTLCLYTGMPGSRKTCSKLNEITKNEIKSIIVGTHALLYQKNFARRTIYLCLSR